MKLIEWLLLDRSHVKTIEYKGYRVPALVPDENGRLLLVSKAQCEAYIAPLIAANQEMETKMNE